MDWPAAGPTSARGSLMFAGGRGDFIEKYLDAYRHWHAGEWNVTAFDWRGQGYSRLRSTGDSSPSFDRLVDDFSSLVDDWRGAMPGPHVIIGHSMGGHLLLRLLVDRKPAIDAAVLVAPMIRVNSGRLPARVAAHIADLLCRLGRSEAPIWKADRPGAEVRRRRALTGSSEHYADEIWWKAQEPAFALAAPTWSWLRDAFRSASAFAPLRLAALNLPILLIGSDSDQLVSFAAIREIAALLPQAELHAYPGAGHEILREADPVRLDALARIDGFLKAHAR